MSTSHMHSRLLCDDAPQLLTLPSSPTYVHPTSRPSTAVAVAVITAAITVAGLL